jgi:DNA-binding MarR family transcriptional regulator
MYMHVLDDVEKSKLREVARACACANLRRAVRVVTQIFDAALAPSGLKCTQFTLLVTARLVGEETVNGLAEKMVMDRTTLSRNLKPLIRAGLLETIPGEDNRTRLIRITAEGKRALGKAYPMWEAAQEEVVGALGSERFEALLGDVSRMTALAVGGAPGSPDGAGNRTT